MNKKGFTVVELIAAFSITMVISVFLFELLIEVKDIFVETSIKTNIEEKNAIISKNINNLFIEEGNTITSCSGNRCTINGKEIAINNDNITINGQKFTTPKDGDETVQITSPQVQHTSSANQGYVKIGFKLTSKNLSKPYEYNVVFYYH